MHAYVRLSFL